MIMLNELLVDHLRMFPWISKPAVEDIVIIFQSKNSKIEMRGCLVTIPCMFVLPSSGKSEV